MTKAQRIKEYNQINKGYAITGIKKLPRESLRYQEINFPKSLDELYQSYSNAKRASWDWIQQTYQPAKIIGLQGSCMTYSVTLVASNGDTLWNTRDNNYQVEVV